MPWSTKNLAPSIWHQLYLQTVREKEAQHQIGGSSWTPAAQIFLVLFLVVTALVIQLKLKARRSRVRTQVVSGFELTNSTGCNSTCADTSLNSFGLRQDSSALQTDTVCQEGQIAFIQAKLPTVQVKLSTVQAKLPTFWLYRHIRNILTWH